MSKWKIDYIRWGSGFLRLAIFYVALPTLWLKAFAPRINNYVDVGIFVFLYLFTYHCLQHAGNPPKYRKVDENE